VQKEWQALEWLCKVLRIYDCDPSPFYVCNIKWVGYSLFLCNLNILSLSISLSSAAGGALMAMVHFVRLLFHPLFTVKAVQIPFFFLGLNCLLRFGRQGSISNIPSIRDPISGFIHFQFWSLAWSPGFYLMHLDMHRQWPCLGLILLIFPFSISNINAMSISSIVCVNTVVTFFSFYFHQIFTFH